MKLACRVALVAICACIFSLPSTALAGPVTVPVDIGLGPAYYFGPGPLFSGTDGHYGVKISVAAILDKQLIEQNIERVPARYRKMVSRTKEIRYGPSIFIPDALIISPKTSGTGMYGVTWRPIALNIPLLQAPVKWTVGAGLLLTYAFIHSDTMAADVTHFLRPGLDLGTRLELSLSSNVLVSLGCVAQGYVPQRVGDLGLPDLADPTALDDSIWLMFQAFVMLHVRFDHTVHLR